MSKRINFDGSLNGTLFVLSVFLLGFFLINLIADYEGLAHPISLINYEAFFPSFYIAAILIGIFFAMGKTKFIWGVIGLDIVYKVILWTLLNRRDEWVGLIISIFAVAEIVVLTIAAIVLIFFRRVSLRKQKIIVWISFVTLLLLNALGYFLSLN